MRGSFFYLIRYLSVITRAVIGQFSRSYSTALPAKIWRSLPSCLRNFRRSLGQSELWLVDWLVIYLCHLQQRKHSTSIRRTKHYTRRLSQCFFPIITFFSKTDQKIKTNINHYLCSRSFISFIFNTVPVFRPIVFFRYLWTTRGSSKYAAVNRTQFKTATFNKTA